MDEIEIVLYYHGIPVMRVITEGVNFESNVEEACIIDRGEDGKLQSIATRPDTPPLMVKFEGRIIEMEAFDMFTKTREGL